MTVQWDATWSKFKLIRVPGHSDRAKCNNCDYDCMELVARLKTHFAVCHSRKRPADNNTDISEEGAPIPNRLIQTTLTPVTGALQKQIEQQFAQTLIAINAPFRSIEHPEVQKLLSMLKPGIKATDRRKLSGSLLDDVYDAAKAKIETKGSVGTLVIDLWSNISNNPVIGVAIAFIRKTKLIDIILDSDFVLK